MGSQSLMGWRTDLLALSMLMAMFCGCVEESRSRVGEAEQPGEIKLVDPTDPKEAPKVVPGAILPPHATDDLPGHTGLGLTKPN
jgi:hypothetical protein